MNLMITKASEVKDSHHFSPEAVYFLVLFNKH